MRFELRGVAFHFRRKGSVGILGNAKSALSWRYIAIALIDLGSEGIHAKREAQFEAQFIGGTV
jgi:hypothetical protein